MFSLSTLLVKLVSAAALLTLIATVTDTLALYLLPNRSTYRHVVYEGLDLTRAKLRGSDSQKQD